MTDFLLFMAKIADELYDLFVYSKRTIADPSKADPEAEKQLAARIIRKAARDDVADLPP